MTTSLIPPDLAPRCESVCREAVRLWGAEAQARQVQEELAELIAAINRFERGRPKSLDALHEECADVILCMLQMRMMFGAGVEDHLRVKLERLERRVDVAAAAEVAK